VPAGSSGSIRFHEMLMNIIRSSSIGTQALECTALAKGNAGVWVQNGKRKLAQRQ
jgi:hypothetical protein